MIKSCTLYWLTRLDPIRKLLEFLLGSAFISIFLVVGVMVLGLMATKIWLVICIAIFIVLIAVGYTVTPTTKEMAAIIIVPKIINPLSGSKELKKLPKNVVELANSWLLELKPKSKSNQPV